MITRKLKREDLPTIDKIYKDQHDHDFDILGIRDRIDDRVVLTRGNVFAYGIIKPYAEAILVIDKTYPRGMKAKAVQLLIEDAKAAIRRAGITQLHTFSRDPDFTRFLMSHFGFNKIVGEGLVLEVESGIEQAS